MSFFQTMTRFFKELVQYRHYIVLYTKFLQKSRVSNTFLGYIWWFLDPLLNMAIYIILVRMAFNQRDPNFPVFFFSAMLVWRYFSMAVQQGAVSISSNLSICKDNYVPKFIFPLTVCLTSLTPFLFSLIFLIAMMFLLQIPITINLLYTPLLILALFLLTWTCTMIVAHINVYMNDFSSILPHLIMIGMFATPIFYSIDHLPEQYQFYMKLNPVGILTSSFRQVFLYGVAPPTKRVLYLIGITFIMLISSVYLLYAHDQKYNKISR